jgi:putative restriction endonuclease
MLLPQSIDHLFDRGLITFADDGDVLVSPIANEDDSIGKMEVNLPIFSGRFNKNQRYFLEYHRSQIFLKSAA